jgi:hypothetical protein
MSQFYRYLLVTDRKECRTQEDAQLDVVSWDDVASIANPADYDGWILNVEVLNRRKPPKVFSIKELNVLFQKRVVAHVLLGRGTIYIIGDFTTAFFTPPSTGTGAGRIKAIDLPRNPPSPQPINPFAEFIGVQRDPRPVDYRRISRPRDYDFKKIYDYLDHVARWDYSLIVDPESKTSRQVCPLGTTNFGTCLAAVFDIGPGRIVVLPSLGASTETDDAYIIEHFLGFVVGVSAPAWVKKFTVPGQADAESRIRGLQQDAKHLVEKLDREKANLEGLQRWKRLLYDDGFGLENIVKEGFEILGAKVEKSRPEKDDFRMTVADRAPCVLEVKGTRKDQFSKRDLRQLSEWIDEASGDLLTEVKGVFVGNASRENEPSARGAMFDSNNLDYAKFKRMVLLRASDLYCLVLLAKLDKLQRDEFWSEFYGCVGLFDAAKYWQSLPNEFHLNEPGDSLNKPS